MTDREMIEEMAKITNFTAFDYRQGTIQSKTIYTAMAEALYEQNYRKIPDGAVVLTKEEMKHPTRTEVIEFFVNHNAEVRKETAREILNEIQTEIFHYLGVKNIKEADKLSLLDSLITYDLITDKLYELAKRYGVEIKE